MSNKETLVAHNALVEQLASKADYIAENFAKPTGNKHISANGSHNVKDYATITVAVLGGSWGSGDGEYDLIVNFGSEDDQGNKTGAYNVSGYCSVNGGSPIYFYSTSQLKLEKIANADSTVEIYINTGRYSYTSNSSSTGCAIDSFDTDYESGLTLTLSSFTADATVYAGIYN